MCGFMLYYNRGDSIFNPMDLIIEKIVLYYGGRCPRCYSLIYRIPTRIIIRPRGRFKKIVKEKGLPEQVVIDLSDFPDSKINITSE